MLDKTSNVLGNIVSIVWSIFWILIGVAILDNMTGILTNGAKFIRDFFGRLTGKGVE